MSRGRPLQNPRKIAYRETSREVCRECGAPTSGRRSGRERTLCQRCKGTLIRVWTRALIRARVREWTRRYGRPPTSTDWHAGKVRTRGGEASARWQTGHWPPASSVTRIYGRFGAAITDAFARAD